MPSIRERPTQRRSLNHGACRSDRAEHPRDATLLSTHSRDHLHALVALRERHQTRHAAHAVRTYSSSSTPPDSEKSAPEPSLRSQILRQYQDIMRKAQGRGATTGLDRKYRWDANANAPAKLAIGTISREEDLPAGNAANAEPRLALQ